MPDDVLNDTEVLVASSEGKPRGPFDVTGPLAISNSALESLAAKEDPLAFIADETNGTWVTWRAYHRGSVGVLQMHGSVWSAWTWQSLADGLYALRHERAVRSIVLSLNSPGGVWQGTLPFAKAIRAVSEVKPVYAHVGGSACSAAYVAAAACREIVISASAEVGCLGSVVFMIDDTKLLRDAGIRRLQFVSSQTPAKNLSPLTPEGAAQLQDKLDRHTDIMLEHVAEFRGVSLEAVLRDYGAGDTRIGADAIEHGMADRFGELETLIVALQTSGVPDMTVRNLTAGAFYQATGVDQVQAVETVDARILAEMPGGETLLESIRAEAHAAGRAEGLAAAEAADEVSAEQLQAAAKAERTRVLEIQALVGDADGLDAVVSAAITEGLTVEAASAKILTEIRTRGIDLNALRTEAPAPLGAGTPGGGEIKASQLWDQRLAKRNGKK